MLDLTGGELFVIGFVVIAVVSAAWWPRVGAAIATRLAGVPPDEPERPSAPPSGRPDSRSGR